MGTPRPDDDCLMAILRALTRYPSPVRTAVPEDGDRADPLDTAIALYADHFQHRADEAIICEAFAAVAPRVFARADALRARRLLEIADRGRPTAGSRAEHSAVLSDLSKLATMFAGPPGDSSGGAYGPLYTETCEHIRAVIELSGV